MTNPSLNLPQALLLDLDDTILDDTGSVVACWRSTCLEFGERIGLDPRTLNEAIDVKRNWYWDDPERHRVGRTDLRAASAHIVDLALQSCGVHDSTLGRTIADRYRDQRDAFICLFPTALKTLEAFRARGIRLAMLTNGSAAAQRNKVERFGLAPYFDAIFIEGERGFGKPDERVYRLAMEALGVESQDAWCVGDNIEWDVLAPQRLGIRGVWINPTGTETPAAVHPERPDLVICELADLLR